MIELPQFILVEDSDEDADTVQQAVLRCKTPMRLTRVSSGDACLLLLQQQTRGEFPALVLMDLNMPGMDGRETLRLIKSNPSLATIPVVVVSTSANPRDLEYCYRAGANAYHVKPMRYTDHLEAMVAVLDYWLDRVVAQPGRRPLP
jgi:CheY-like chemotaxis protein